MSSKVVNTVVENVAVKEGGKVKKPVLPAKYARIYQCVFEVLNSCLTEPENGVPVTEELMEGILGVMGFYEDSVATQIEFFEKSIFEKENLKQTKKSMKNHVKLVRQKSGLEPVKPKKERKSKVEKDPNAPKKERKPRAKKVPGTPVLEPRESEMFRDEPEPESVNPKKERKSKVEKDPNAPKKERKPRAKKVPGTPVLEPRESEMFRDEPEPEPEPEVVVQEPEPVKEEKPKKKVVKKTKKTTEVVIDTPVDE